MQHVSAKVQNAIIRPMPPYFVHLYHNGMSLLYIIIIIIIIIYNGVFSHFLFLITVKWAQKNVETL